MKRIINMPVRALLLLSAVAMIWSAPLADAQEPAADTGIKFEHGTWEEAVNKAKAENKLLFVDVWATWCGPCRKLAKEVFTDPEVGEFFNKNFVCYKLMIDEQDDALREKNENIARNYNAGALPTLLWINNEGKAEHSSVGYKPAAKILEEARKALDPSARVSNNAGGWADQPHTIENAVMYFPSHRDAIAEFDDFFIALSPEDKKDERITLMLYSSLTLNADSKALQYMAANPEWYGMAESQLHRLLGAIALGEENTITDKFEKYNIPFLPRLKDDMVCLKLFRFGRIDEAFALGNEMIDRYGDSGLDFLGDFVDVCFFMATKQHTLLTPDQKNTVLDWSKRYCSTITSPNDYRKYLNAFEANAIAGKHDEAAANIEKVKSIIGARYTDPVERSNGLKFYEGLEESAKDIR